MKVLVHTASPGLENIASALADRLGVNFSAERPSGQDILWFELVEEDPAAHYRLKAVCNLAGKELRLDLDYGSGKIRWRTRHAGMKQALARAAGLAKHSGDAAEPYTVLDLTGGFGRDAFTLAALGTRVTMIERNPLVAAITRNAIDRAGENPEISAIASRLTLTEDDSIRLLTADAGFAGTFDALYLDPMFPASGKSAEVKKESQMLRLLNAAWFNDITEETDALLRAACNTAVSRVVLKRPKSAPVTQNPAPTGIIEGKTIRYEIFTGTRRQQA